MSSAVLFALLAVVCTVFAFTRHPIWGFYFYLATTYVFPPVRWWGYMFGGMRWALLSAAVTVLAIMFHKGKLLPKPLWVGNGPAVLLIMYASWMWLQTPWALDLDAHINGTSIYTKYVLAFWFVYRVCDTKEHLRDSLLAHLLGCTFLGVLAQFTGRDGDRLDGVGGPGIDDANTLGMYLVTGVIIAIGLFLTQKGWRRYLSLICMAIVANGFILANSRGAFLGLAAGGIVLAVSKAKEHRRIFWAFALFGVLGLASLVDEAFINRMFTIQDVSSHDEDADMSARSRVEVAKAQLRMFIDHPMGVGHRGTASLSAEYLDRKWLSSGGDEDQRARSSHSTFLTALVEQGVPGVLMYIAMVIWIFGAIWRIRGLKKPTDDPELATLGSAMCAALVSVLVSGNTADYLLAEVHFWQLAALVSMLQFSFPMNQAGVHYRDVAGMRRMPAPGAAPQRQ